MNHTQQNETLALVEAKLNEALSLCERELGYRIEDANWDGPADNKLESIGGQITEIFRCHF